MLQLIHVELLTVTKELAVYLKLVIRIRNIINDTDKPIHLLAGFGGETQDTKTCRKAQTHRTGYELPLPRSSFLLQRARTTKLCGTHCRNIYVEFYLRKFYFDVHGDVKNAPHLRRHILLIFCYVNSFTHNSYPRDEHLQSYHIIVAPVLTSYTIFY